MRRHVDLAPDCLKKISLDKSVNYLPKIRRHVDMALDCLVSCSFLSYLLVGDGTVYKDCKIVFLVSVECKISVLV